MVVDIAVTLLIITVILACGGYFLTQTSVGNALRLRIKGSATEKVIQDASTVDGATAYYNTAIEKKEEDHRQAHLIYTQMLGKIQTYQEQLRSLQKEEMSASLNVNRCVEQGDDEGARVYLERQEDIKEKMEIIKDALKQLQENSVLQKETVDAIFDELGDLKAEKETAILTLETAQVTKTLQVTASSAEEDKMLEKVRDGVRKKKEEASGSKIAYESSSAVQQKRLDKRMKDEEIEKKLAQLKQQKGR